MSERELKEYIEEFANSGTPIQLKAPPQKFVEYLDKTTGELKQVPEGVGAGWDYNPGQAAWGKQLSQKKMAEHKAQKADVWEQLTPGDFRTYSLSQKLKGTKPVTKIGPKITDSLVAVKALEKILGDKEKVFSFKGEGDFRYDLLVNAETLINHIDLSRTPFLPLLPETLTDPDEVWLRFDKHKGTGKVVLRQRIIKRLDLGKRKGLLVVCEAKNGWIEAWTMMPITSENYVNKQRTGKLVYKKK